MKSILIFVLVVAVVIMVIGLANLNGRADVGYVFGTWDDASLLAVSAVAAGVVLLVGIVAALLAVLHARRDRHKLEVELQQLYVRLRAAEGALAASTFEGPALHPETPRQSESSRTVAVPEPVTRALRSPEAAASGGESGDEPAD